MPPPGITKTSPSNDTKSSGYRDSFKASAILGGSQVISYILGILRTKSLAYLIGPSGIGLVGLYTSIINALGTVSGLGIGESAIREIAAARGSGDDLRLGVVAKVIRRTCLLSGIFGLVLCAALATPLSFQSFSNNDHSFPLAILGITVLLTSICNAETAIIQGSGKFGEMAKMNIVCAISGLLPILAIYFWFREKGIVPALILSSLLTLGIALFYSRRIKIPDVSVTWKQFGPELKILLILGFAFLVTGLLGAGKDMWVRSLITKGHGIEATGLYQSAWAISGLFASFVLKAMGLDFYPRLTAMVNDHGSVARAVDQQIEIGVLLVLPGVIATITCAPFVLLVLYTSQFQAGSSLLSILACGVFFKIVSYPINTIQLAKGDARGFMMIGGIHLVFELAITAFFLLKFGLIGAAVAYPIACALHIPLMLFAGRRLVGYRPGGRCILLSAISLTLIAIALSASLLLDDVPSLLMGVVLSFAASIYSGRELIKRLGEEHRISGIFLRIPVVGYLMSVGIRRTP